MTEMGEPVEHKALMRRIVEVFATGDLSKVRSVIAAGYVDHQGLDGTEIRGPEGFSGVVRAARGGLADLRIDIEDLIAEGDKVVARLRWRGTRSTGERTDRETIEIVRVTNDQAVEHWGMRLGPPEGGPRGSTMNEAAVTALLRRIYGGALDVHSDLHEKSERHRDAHGQGCTVYPHSLSNAPIWPMLAAMTGARRFLEVGCGLGYSAALMAEAGGPESRVDTIEKAPEHADIARQELLAKGLHERVQILRGEATDILPTLQQPYDVVFMDSDWKDYPALLPHVTRLTLGGGILLTSNLFPLFEEWASSLPYKDAVEEYLVGLVRDARFRTFLIRSEWKALSYKLP